MKCLKKTNSRSYHYNWIKVIYLIALRSVAACILLLLWTGSSAQAQIPHFDSAYGFGNPADNTTSVTLGDLNADGALDIIAGGDSRSQIFVNDGRGKFGTGIALAGTSQTSAVAVGDLNGDGALDIVVDAQQNQVFLNDGKGNFPAGIVFGSHDQISSIAVGDLNGDGALDIVIGEKFYQSPVCPLCVYLNDGSGHFQNTISVSTTAEIDNIVVGDLNGDGALDIATVSTIYLNDGSGHFPNSTPFNEFGGSCVAIGDINNDGMLDIVVGIEDEQQNLIFMNNEGGQFSEGVPLNVNDSTTSIALGDINGDGALDIVVGNEQYEIAPSLFYLNDNMGHFSASVSLNAPDFTTSVTLGDLNGDGTLDIVVGNRGQNLVFMNNGSGQLFADPQSGKEKPSSIVTLGDFNNDSNLDLVAYNQIYFNEGDGNFSNPITLPITGSLSDAVVGDLNNDGALDIILGKTGKNSVFLNNGAGNFSLGTVFGEEANDTNQSLLYGGKTLGDLNGDGTLDIVSRNVVYLNNGRGNFSSSLSFGDKEKFTAMAVGDFDGDGDLDIAVNYSSENGAKIRLYLNDGLANFLPMPPFGSADQLVGIAVGDINGDGSLDLVAGHTNAQNLIYLNDGLGHIISTIPLGSAESNEDIEVTDIDSDGDLDIVTSNRYQPNQIYVNDGSGKFDATILFGSEVIFAGDSSENLTIGDIDRDGSQDIIVNGVYDIYVYRKDKWSLRRLTNDPPYLALERPGKTANANYYSTPEILTDRAIPFYYSLYDPEGDPIRSVRAQYSLDGGGHWKDATPTVETKTGDLPVRYGYTDNTQQGSGELNWIDITNTGNAVTLKDDTIQGPLPIGFSFPFYNGTFNQFWISSNGWLTFSDPLGNSAYTNKCLPQKRSPINLIAPLWDDLNPEAGGRVLYQQLNNQMLIIEYFQVPSYANGGVNTFEVILKQDGSISFQYLRVAQPQDSATVGLQNGNGSQSSQVVCNKNHIHDNLVISFPNGRHTYYWDTFASNFFGYSSNVVFRIIAYPDMRPRPNGTAGPYQRPYVSTQTFPFRARGTQVQVFNGVATEGKELPNVFVYRLEQGQSAGATLMPNAKRPLHSDTQGYLQGRGELRIADQLAALWPVTGQGITFTHNYTLYYTSAKPTATTLDMKAVDKPGVQTLVVSADNKLLLFNLDVALEWDAHKDTQFMEQLRFNLQRTSQLLFDWSNGQVALGQVRIFQDAKRNTAVAGFHPWDDSHIRIYATNRMRPSATVGGIISPTLEMNETVQGKTINYGPGQVHMGAIWNRYGESSGTLGEDWPRALAHELGHYLFFLEDDYLGLNEQGMLVTIQAEGDPANSCPGAMNDPYREAQSEFQPAAGWAAGGCSKTLAHQSTGRSDWQTIKQFYPPLTAPSEPFSGQNPGPSTLPLAVTQLTVISPTAPGAQPVDVPIFYLTGPGGGTYVPGSNAQAYLFQGDWLTDLGQPALDQVQAWGARTDVDRICVYEASVGRLGCEKIRLHDDQLALQQATPWQPEIVVAPVTSRTIEVNVTVVLDAGQRLAARLYPTDAPAPSCILLQPTSAGQYGGTFPTLNEPALDGYIHLWVQGDTACTEPTDAAVQETVTGYAIGGNPAHRRSRRTLSRGSGAHRRSRRAPAISADGQVMVFGDALDLNQDQEWFYTLQATGVVTPAIPPGRTRVGQAYRLTASANAPKLTDAVISFGYLGEQVPAGEEGFLRIYFLDSTTNTWRPLATFRDPLYNVTSAKTQGPGLYALMSSLEIPLTTVGWNNFADPVPGKQPVAEVLAAIEGAYTVVYSYQPGQPDDAWRVYGPQAPDWVNDLKELEFGQGYWLHTTAAITIYLSSQEAAQSASVEGLMLPPATYYGTVSATADLVPQVGMEVSAWIGEQRCGTGQVQEQDGQLVYKVKVAAEDGSAHAGCGAAGRTITFQVNDVTMTTDIGWDNTRVRNTPLPLQFNNQLFIPLVFR